MQLQGVSTDPRQCVSSANCNVQCLVTVVGILTPNGHDLTRTLFWNLYPNYSHPGNSRSYLVPFINLFLLELAKFLWLSTKECYTTIHKYKSTQVPLGFDNRMMICIYSYSTIKSNFTSLKIPVFHLFIFPSPLTPGNH